MRCREVDLLACPPETLGARLLLRTPVPVVPRRPPLFLDAPGGGDAGFPAPLLERLRRHDAAAMPDRYVLDVQEARLFGQRAVVTPTGALVSDEAADPPRRPLFPARRRAFERMPAEAAADGWLEVPSLDAPAHALSGEAVLLASTEPANYGAWLLRVLAKLVTLRETGLDRLPLLAPAFLPWMRPLLRAYGVAEEQVVPHDQFAAYAIRRLLVPSIRCPGFNIEPCARALFENLAEDALRRNPGPAHALLYVSRRSVGQRRPDYRRCLNEDAVIALLEGLGFHAFEPEAHPVEHQMAVFRRAELVVGPSGAGMFNLVHCRAGTRVLQLEPLPDWIEGHAAILGSLGFAHGFILGGADPTDPAPVQKRWTADLDALRRRVREMMG